MKISLVKEPEMMGIFGFSWPEKVTGFMLKRLKGSVYEPKLKDFFQASGRNQKLVENMHREYLALMAQGKNPVTFSLAPDASGNGGQMSPDGNLLAQQIFNKTAIDMPIINEFLRALFVLSRDGKIPYEKWNPKGYQQAKEVSKSAFESEQGFFDKLKPAGDTMKTVLLVAGIGVSAYLLNQLKGLVK